MDFFDKNRSFQEMALEVFRYQIENNAVYRTFCETLGLAQATKVSDFPLLPIQAFKDAPIITISEQSEANISELPYFQSSGTAGMQRSTHYLLDTSVYKHSILKGMNEFYNIDDYVIWAYTPGYSENPNSSLIWMLNVLIEQDKTGLSRFLELNKPLPMRDFSKIKDAGKKLMIFGAAFGLLDVLEIETVNVPPDTIIMETGGMKTYRREMNKGDLHRTLAGRFGLPQGQIHSEYGMAELLSQAYSLGDEWFKCVPWMEVSIRNPKNPLECVANGKEGLIGIIDLANIHSCAFILTGDRGVMSEDGRFKVLGRWDPQNLRDCNFLIDQD